jgi:uncharacterized membrane protein
MDNIYLILDEMLWITLIIIILAILEYFTKKRFEKKLKE